MKPFFMLLTGLLFSGAVWASDGKDWLDAYNPCWTTQSRNSSESMPCGGGDIGMNVWVEDDEVFLYLSRSGVFDENNVFPKLGRVRLSFHPNPFEGASFKQELKLRDGYVEIEAVKDGKRQLLRFGQMFISRLQKLR